MVLLYLELFRELFCFLEVLKDDDDDNDDDINLIRAAAEYNSIKGIGQLQHFLFSEWKIRFLFH